MENFNHIVRLIRGLKQQSRTDRYVSGVLNAYDADDIELLADASSSSSDEIQVQHCNGNDNQASIEIKKDGQNYLIANDLDDILKNVKHLTSEPNKPYFLLDVNCSSTEQVAYRSVIAQYRSVIKIFNILEQASLFFEPKKATPTLYLIKNNAKFSIPILYSLSDFHHLLEISAGKLNKFLGADDVHRQQRLQIIADVVTDFTEDISVNARFSHLLRDIANIIQEIENRYVLFTSDFKYSKVKDDFELAKIDFTKKTNDVLTAIQSQVIALPIGLIAVFTQIKSVERVCSSQFLINLVILVSALAIALLFNTLIANQNAVLTNIKVEIERQNKLLETQYAAIKKNFTDLHSVLDSRVRTQEQALRYIRIFVWGAFAISFCYFFFQIGWLKEIIRRILL